MKEVQKEICKLISNKYFHKPRKRDKSGNMLSFNPLQLLTLVLMLSLCMANPVNRSADKEDELVINKDLTRTNKSEVPDTGKEKTEESQKKASWETAKYIFISWS